MTSKNSFFDLFKNRFIRNIWELLAFSLVFAIFFPVACFISIGQRMNGSELFSETRLSAARRYIFNDFAGQVSGIPLIMLLTLMAAVCAYVGFSYLHESKQTDFYHSLPVKRSTLFAVNTLVNIAFVAVPYLIMSFFSALIVSSASGHSGCIIMTLSGFLSGMAFFLLIFMTAVLSMMLTGNSKVAVLGMIVLFAWGPYVITLWEGLYSQYFDTYYRLWENTNAIIKYTSPVAWALGPDGSNVIMRAVVAFILAILLYGINLLLYRHRKSEKAGSSMAFKLTEIPIKFIIAVPAAVGIMALFGGLMNNSPSWGGVSSVLGALIVCGIMEIIYALDFKKFFAHLAATIGCVLVTLIIFAFFNFDLSGYDLYNPDLSDVDSIGIYTSALEDIYGRESILELDEGSDEPSLIYRSLDNQDVVDRMNIKDNAALANDILRAISEFAGKYDKDIYRSTSAQTSDTIWNLLARWKLKNGKTVYRQYTLDMSMVSQDLSALYDTREYKEGTYPLLTWSEEELDDLTAVGYQDILGLHTIPFEGLDEEEKKNAIRELYDTYKSELLSLTAQDRSTESPVTTLQFRNSYFEETYQTYVKYLASASYNELDYVGHYPVYSSFTGTLELMQRYGARINADLDADNVDSIAVTDLGIYGSNVVMASEDVTQAEAVTDSESTTPKPNLVVTDKDEIQKILDVGLYNLSCSNSLRARWDSTDCILNLSMKFLNNAASTQDTSGSSISSTLYIYFPADSIPDFVREYFDITDEEIAEVTNCIGWPAGETKVAG